MKGIVGETSVRVGRLDAARPAARRAAVAPAPAGRIWAPARPRGSAAVSYVVPRPR